MIYLNNAATSYPRPPGVKRAVTDCLDGVPSQPERAGFACSCDVAGRCRENLARLFNAETDEILFTSGATESLNLVLWGLDLHGHVVTTSIEHNSVLRPLKTLEKQDSIALTIVDCDRRGFLDPDAIRQALREDTQAVVVNHGSNVTGMLTDIRRIAVLVHECSEAVVVVDAAQTAGVIPIDVRQDNPDILIFTGHKSLYGPPGTGGLYLRRDLDLRPLKVGGTGIRSDLLTQPEQRPLKYEAGTANIPGLAGLGAGVEYVLQEGPERIREKAMQSWSAIMSALRELEGFTLYGDSEHIRLPVLSFTLAGMSPADLGYLLEQSFGIIVRTGLHCAPLIHHSLGSFPEGTVRLSPSAFTSNVEVECFINAMKQIHACGCVV